MTRALYFICLFCLWTIVMGTQCRKDVEYPSPKHCFKEKVQLTPAKKLYNVGDTIWISLTTPDQSLFDTVTNQRVSTAGSGFLFGASLLAKYETPSNPPDGYCNFILPTGVSATTLTTQSGTFTRFRVGCDNASNYSTRIGVVLNHQGTYIIDMATASTVEPCNAQATRVPPPYLRLVFDLADTNKDVYQAIPVQNRNEFPAAYMESWLDAKVAFALKVE